MLNGHKWDEFQIYEHNMKTMIKWKPLSCNRQYNQLWAEWSIEPAIDSIPISVQWLYLLLLYCMYPPHMNVDCENGLWIGELWRWRKLFILLFGYCSAKMTNTWILKYYHNQIWLQCIWLISMILKCASIHSVDHKFDENDDLKVNASHTWLSGDSMD